MSLLKINSVQIGQSATATQNFTLSVPSSPDGTIKLARGNSGATTADIISIDASGNVVANITAGSIPSGSISAAKLTGAQSGSAPIFGVRAWCVFDGTLAGTNAPTSGGNVASVTRNSAGDYTVTFSTAMPNANYAVIGMATNVVAGSPETAGCLVAGRYLYAQTTGATGRLKVTQANSATLTDCPYVSVIVVG
jgi:hypothetical protein